MGGERMGKTTITAPVNKIISFSAVDGFGNRTAIFLQGCNQNCWYCHNPETIRHCRACGACVAACPAGALELVEASNKYGDGGAQSALQAEGSLPESEKTREGAALRRYVTYDPAKCLSLIHI